MNQLTFPAKGVGETQPYVVNFSDRLQFGEAINGAATTASVFSGTDPLPVNILSGSPTFTATTLTQVITGGVAGVIYTVVFTVTGTSSHNYTKTAQLSVIDPNAPF